MRRVAPSAPGSTSCARVYASSPWYPPGSTAAEPRPRRFLGRTAVGPGSPVSGPPAPSSPVPSPSNSSVPIAGTRLIQRQSARSRSGIACTGVAVTTSTPKKPSITRSGTATHALSAAVSGAEITQPTTPPAARTSAQLCVGSGTPADTETRPQTESVIAMAPMATRPLTAVRSGWRMSRIAKAASSTGTTRPITPKSPATTLWIAVPAVPESANHSRAAITIAKPRRVKASPSRRCAGSRPFAPRPTPRTAPPTMCATPIHSPRTARTSSGERFGGGVGALRGPDARVTDFAG